MVAVSAQLGFLKPLDLYKTEKPYWLFIGKPEKAPDVDLTNVVIETISGIPVCDVRNHESSYTLDENGFQFITHNQTFDSFHNEQLIRNEFFPQVEKVIKNCMPYAERIHIYDWRVSGLSLKE